MGAEGYVKLRRVDAGEFEVSDDPRVAQFVVREPVAVLWLWFRSIRDGAWTNLEVPETLMGLVDQDSGPMRTELTILPGCGALLVVPQRVLAEYHATGKEWARLLAGEGENGIIPLGSEPFQELKKAWDAITPGRWIVERYWSLGTGPDSPSHHFSMYGRKELVLGKSVEWEIWT